VSSASAAHDDPYFKERGLLIEYEDEVHGTITAPGVVPQLAGTPGRVRSPASWEVGSDTEAVLQDLGLEQDEIDQLRRDDVL
jgi:formyl-CoA transferase